LRTALLFLALFSPQGPQPTTRPKGPDYAAHVKELKKTLPREFHVVVSKPFVVIGDEAPVRVEAKAETVVKWAVDLLKKDFFKKDPEHIINIWLFKDAESYRKNALELFGDRPTTKYGYYSPEHKALVMDISTGGGTLVHEIVHPFMHANFPDCPSWFNEGLASLYEQSHKVKGTIQGMTNWRLAGLQREIRKGSLPSFKELCATTSQQFYYADRGNNYAQARYLCYYLQEKKLLRKYYRAFVANCKKDPTGYKTLVKLLGEPDMTKFQRSWEAWILRLRY